MKKNNAFSLVELMVVIAIIGILSAIAVPSYKTYVIKSRVVELFNISQEISSRIIQAYNAGQSWSSITDLFPVAPTSPYVSLSWAQPSGWGSCMAGTTSIGGIGILGNSAAIGVTGDVCLVVAVCIANDVIQINCGVNVNTQNSGNAKYFPTQCQQNI